MSLAVLLTSALDQEYWKKNVTRVCNVQASNQDEQDFSIALLADGSDEFNQETGKENVMIDYKCAAVRH
jgi:hypothetical protein